MTSTTSLVPTAEPEPSVVKSHVLGRVQRTPEQRERILNEYERSGLSGPKFAALCGVKYQTVRNGFFEKKLKNLLGTVFSGIAAARWGSLLLVEGEWFPPWRARNNTDEDRTGGRRESRGAGNVRAEQPGGGPSGPVGVVLMSVFILGGLRRVGSSTNPLLI